jgi:hypothetical protein
MKQVVHVQEAVLETTTSNSAGSPRVEYAEQPELLLAATAGLMSKLLQVPKEEADEVHRGHARS